LLHRDILWLRVWNIKETKAFEPVNQIGKTEHKAIVCEKIQSKKEQRVSEMIVLQVNTVA